jgi:hypothetical protein
MQDEHKKLSYHRFMASKSGQQAQGIKVDLGIVQDIIAETKKLSSKQDGMVSAVDRFADEFKSMIPQWDDTLKLFRKLEANAKELGVDLPKETARYEFVIQERIDQAKNSIALIQQI